MLQMFIFVAFATILITIWIPALTFLKYYDFHFGVTIAIMFLLSSDVTFKNHLQCKWRQKIKQRSTSSLQAKIHWFPCMWQPQTHTVLKHDLLWADNSHFLFFVFSKASQLPPCLMHSSSRQDFIMWQNDRKKNERRCKCMSSGE